MTVTGLSIVLLNISPARGSAVPTLFPARRALLLAGRCLLFFGVFLCDCASAYSQLFFFEVNDLGDYVLLHPGMHFKLQVLLALLQLRDQAVVLHLWDSLRIDSGAN